MLHAVSQISSLRPEARCCSLLGYILPYHRQKLTSELMTVSMSFMYTKKRTRPTTDPCGTPDVTGLAVDG